jgi:hypothetical protein
MTHEPDWLVRVLEELAERETFPAAPPFTARLLDTLVSPRERHWGRRAAVAGAATVSLSAVALLVLRLVSGRWIARRPA